MRQTTVLLAVALVATIAGCKKEPPPQPPAPPPAPTLPPPAPPPSTEPAKVVSDYDKFKAYDADQLDKLSLFADVNFDYDKSDLRDAARTSLQQHAATLKKFDFMRVTVEGHCDERGTVDYNHALGERRSRAVFDYLVSLGVGADRMKMVSYGKEFPLCKDSTEACWARNRRGHLTVTGNAAKVR